MPAGVSVMGGPPGGQSMPPTAIVHAPAQRPAPGHLRPRVHRQPHRGALRLSDHDPLVRATSALQDRPHHRNLRVQGDDQPAVVAGPAHVGERELQEADGPVELLGVPHPSHRVG